MTMFFLMFSLFFLVFHAYPLWVISTWLWPEQSFKKRFLLIFVYGIMMLALSAYGSAFSLTILRLSYYEFGFMLLLLPLTVIGQILWFAILRKNRFINAKKMALSVLTLSVLISAYAIFNYQKPLLIKHFTLESSKVSKSYHLLHLTDTQYGTASVADLKKVASAIEKINKKTPLDAIIFTGDAVDTSQFNLTDLKPLALHNLGKINKYFSLGNHEFYHDYPKPHLSIEALGYKVLRSEKTTLDELNIFAIDDPIAIEKEDIDKALANELPLLIDNKKFNVFMYHRPLGVDTARQHNIELMLTGHTHGGQLFPYALLVQSLYPYPFGLVKFDNMTLFNSDGASLWGPRMRLGSRNEIAVFTIRPKEN